jgi:uncharacterized protein YndB with AHSA1/START domain
MQALMQKENELNADGELEGNGKDWQLHFTRRLRHSPEKVWAALTESEQLAAWFPQRIVGEWKPGAPLRFEHTGFDAPGFEGEVLRCEPPSLLEFRWGTDTLRFEIVPDGAGCTLTLVDLIDAVGKAARDGAGWHVCLDLLEYTLDGKAASWGSGERWGEVHPGYVAKFGPEAATIGPPTGLKPKSEAEAS